MPFSNAGKMDKISGQGKTFGALLTDLSKAFNFFDYELLIEKLNTHEFCLETKDPRIQRSNPSKRFQFFSEFQKVQFLGHHYMIYF